MTLVCREVFSNLSALRGQSGRTQSGFKFFTDGFNGSTRILFKRQKASDLRDINSVLA